MIDELDKSTIISLFPLPIMEEKPGIFPGRFTIAASNGEPSLLVIGQSIHNVDIGENRPQLQIANSSSDVARSIVDDFIAAQLAVTENIRPGVTWLRGTVTSTDLKTKHRELVVKLKEQHNAWYLELVKLADDDWQRYHKHTVISELQRIAAKSLGYANREWLIVPEQLQSSNCPACGTSIVPTIVVCPQCRCIIDKAKYSQMAFAQ